MLLSRISPDEYTEEKTFVVKPIFRKRFPPPVNSSKRTAARGPFPIYVCEEFRCFLLREHRLPMDTTLDLLLMVPVDYLQKKGKFF